jgi:predicted transcriptional regulator
MTLSEYLKQPGNSVSGLARILGVHRATLHKIAVGDRNASTPLARKIFDATDGLVTPTDLALSPQRLSCNAPAKIDHSATSSARPKTGQAVANNCKGGQKVSQTAQAARKAPKGARSPNNTG